MDVFVWRPGRRPHFDLSPPLTPLSPLSSSPSKVILPDYLPGNPYSDLIQPVWCSYALGARPSIVISTDGTIWFQQTWLQTQDLAHHLDMLLKHLSPGSAGGSRVDESTVSGGGGPAVEEGQRKEHGGGQS